MRASPPSITALALGLLLGAAAGPAGAQQDRPPQSAPISDVRYTVTFDSATARTRTMRVEMAFGVAGDAPVLLSLPAWTPGAYEIANFARNVTAFAATGDGARPLQWDKLDYDTWRIRPAGSRAVSVTFDYRADSLDNAAAWTRRDFGFFNGTNLFLYPEGRPLDFPATVVIRTHPGWLVTTSMTPGPAPRTYTAGNYHDLVDMPFFIGRFDLDSAQVANRWVRLATWPRGVLAGAARTDWWTQQKRIMPVESAVFEDTPFPTYTTFMVFDSTTESLSALEHQSSHLGVYSPLMVGNALLPSFTAHEEFHAWNVKRLRPADLWPYTYDRPQPTPWLWVSEGITDYYADLTEARAKLVDAAGFYRLTAGKMDEVAAAPPVALTDASLSTWIHPVDGTGYLYYPKGSLAGLLLDVLIRDASDNHHSLDDVMRELYRAAYKQGRGFTPDDWWGAVSRAAGGRSFTEFYARYIDGREPFPYDSVLPLAGLRLRSDTTREPRIGVFTVLDSAGVRVTDLEDGGAAAAGGVRSGDYLVTVADIAVTDATFANRFRARFAHSAAKDYPVRVRRGTQLLTLTLPLRVVEQISRELMADPKASEKAVRIRTGILEGRTEG